MTPTDPAPNLDDQSSGLAPTVLPGDAFVIRGGLIGNLDDLIEQAETAAADGEGNVLSTFAAARDQDESDDDLIRRIVTEGKIPNGQLRVATVDQLLAEGFSLRQTGTPPCHYDVDLGEEITRDAVARFEATFGPARKNPCPIRRN